MLGGKRGEETAGREWYRTRREAKQIGAEQGKIREGQIRGERERVEKGLWREKKRRAEQRRGMERRRE